ncbi:acyltransferase domain-containing protein [Nocardia sp. NPDC004722]
MQRSIVRNFNTRALASMTASHRVFLFAGSNYEPSAMALRAIVSDPALAAIVEDCDRAAVEFGRPTLTQRCREDAREDEPAPEDAHIAQFVASIHRYRRASAHGARPYALVGHSLGELWALTCAGAISALDTARLVYRRGELLRAGARSGGMLAIGVDEGRAHHLVGLIDAQRLTLACVNAPRQCVVSGDTEQLALAGKVATQMGWSVHRLAAPYPYHSSALASVRGEFRSDTVKYALGTPEVPVYSPILARYHQASEDAAAVLADALIRPVRFADAVRTLHAQGADHFVDCGEGELTRCVQATLPSTVIVETVTAANGSIRSGTESPAHPGRPTPVPQAIAPAAEETVESVAVRLQRLYAERLGYPLEEMTLSADLEADLGIDSLKQTELLAIVGKQFGTDRFDHHPRLLEFPTLRHIAEAVGNDRSGRSA